MSETSGRPEGDGAGMGPSGADGTEGVAAESGEVTAAGWDAIDAACRRLYGDQPPRHVAYAPGRAFGSVLQGCSAYRAGDHWHYVTYGLSNLFDDDEGDNDGFSGWGYELTWRVRDAGAEGEAPGWPFTVLQRVAKWASDAGVLLADGSFFTIGSSITGHPHSDGPETPLNGVLLVADPELGEIHTPNGRVQFLQLVGIGPETFARLEADAAAVTDQMRQEDALLVTVVGG
ncbi:suppressor of fused protein SUFU [Cellulomonas sp. SLBN-39]|nr:suppressor of fused protein SUFU [Cellulomonas sp. SLBN-39]